MYLGCDDIRLPNRGNCHGIVGCPSSRPGGWTASLSMAEQLSQRVCPFTLHPIPWIPVSSPFLGPTGRFRSSTFPLIGVSFICWVRLGTLPFWERKHPVEGPIWVGTPWGWTKRKWRIFSSIEPLSHPRIGKGWLDRGARVAHLQHGMVWILPRLAEKVRKRCSRLESERNTLDGGVKSKGGDAWKVHVASKADGWERTGQSVLHVGVRPPPTAMHVTIATVGINRWNVFEIVASFSSRRWNLR